jgi:hypothetical protein
LAVGDSFLNKNLGVFCFPAIIFRVAKLAFDIETSALPLENSDDGQREYPLREEVPPHMVASGSDKLERFTETGANTGSLGVFGAKYLIRLMRANAKMFDKFGA